jgi:hypothetical protein
VTSSLRSRSGQIAIATLAVHAASRFRADFAPGLAPFRLDACAFRPTDTGLTLLYSLG